MVMKNGPKRAGNQVESSSAGTGQDAPARAGKMTRTLNRPTPSRAENRPGAGPFRSASSTAAPTSAVVQGRWGRVWLAWLTALLVVGAWIPSESAAAEGTGVVSVMLWLVLLVSWFTSGLLLGGITLRAGPTLIALLVFLGLHTMAALFAVRTGEARPAWNMLWQWVSFAVAFFLARQLLVTGPQRRAVAAVMIGMAVCLSCYGFYQYGYLMPQLRADYAANPEAELARAGIVAPPGSPERRQFENRLASTEPIATFALTNSLAGLLAPWLIVVLGAVAWQTRPTPAFSRTVAAAALAVLAVGLCLLLTKSRTAWLATGCGVVLLLIYGRQSGWRPSWKWLLLAATAIPVLFLVATRIGGLDWLVLTESLKSLTYRLEFWQATWALIGDFPWWGCGPGNFQAFYSAYKLPQASETIADPHNWLLEIWATAGTPALLAFLALLIAFGWQVQRELKRRRSQPTDRFTATEGEGSRGERGTRGSSVNSTQRADRLDMLAVYAGGLLGVGLSFFPCGFLVGYVPDATLLSVGVPVAGVFLVLMVPWVLGGRLSEPVLLVAIATLLLNLSAAGGIGFAGVALSFWLLLALCLNEAESAHPKDAVAAPSGETAGPSKATDGLWSLSPTLVSLPLLGSLFLLIGCYLTAYAPILNSAAWISEGALAQQTNQPEAAERAYRRAAATDPYAVTPWQYLAALHHARWLATGSSSARQAFADTVEQLVRHNPHSSPLRRNLGDWYLQAYRQLGDAAALRQAVAAYQEAVKRYPNHSFGRAQLAWALHLAGEKEQASAAATEALRLDELNPHQEQKLAARSLFDPGPSAKLLNPTAEPTEPTAKTDRALTPALELMTAGSMAPSTNQPPRPSGHAELICHQLRSPQ